MSRTGDHDARTGLNRLFLLYHARRHVVLPPLAEHPRRVFLGAKTTKYEGFTPANLMRVSLLLAFFLCCTVGPEAVSYRKWMKQHR